MLLLAIFQRAAIVSRRLRVTFLRSYISQQALMPCPWSPWLQSLSSFHKMMPMPQLCSFSPRTLQKPARTPGAFSSSRWPPNSLTPAKTNPQTQLSSPIIYSLLFSPQWPITEEFPFILFCFEFWRGTTAFSPFVLPRKTPDNYYIILFYCSLLPEDLRASEGCWPSLNIWP